MNKIKTLLQSSTVKKLTENVVSLFINQASNYIIPLIIVPYLTRILEPEGYGIYNLGLVYVAYFKILTDYGFTLSAPRQVSQSNRDVAEVSRLFSTIATLQMLLFLLSTPLYFGIIYAVPKFTPFLLFFSIFYFNALANTFSIVWLFQGMQEMRNITFTTLMLRIVSIIATFLFVKAKSDLQLFIAINSATAMITSVISIVYAISLFKLRYHFPTWQQMQVQLIQGWNVFISSLGISLYTLSIPMIIAFMCNETELGFYAGAEKIRTALQGIFIPWFTAAYPYISNLCKDNAVKARNFIKMETKVLGGVMFMFVIVAELLAKPAVSMLLGNKFLPSVPVLRIMILAVVFVVFGNIVMIQYLLNFGKQREYRNIYISAGIIGILLIGVLTHFIGIIGATIGTLLIEAYILVRGVLVIIPDIKRSKEVGGTNELFSSNMHV